jgi:hypothetical protein
MLIADNFPLNFRINDVSICQHKSTFRKHLNNVLDGYIVSSLIETSYLYLMFSLKSNLNLCNYLSVLIC